MKVRQTDVSEADIKSAKIFFDAVLGFFDLSNATVLDAFARNGQLTVSNYHDHVGAVECWELGPEHEEALRKYTDEVKIGDSYSLLDGMGASLYDMIVIDTPQGLHKDNHGAVMCEHFDFLPHAISLLTEGGIVVLYCNKAPYDKDKEGSQGYDEYEEYDFKNWMAARQNFYNVSNGREVAEEDMLIAYRDLIADEGRELGRVVMIPCFSDVPNKEPYAFRLALEIL
ncbi:methyltransferase [Stenotrophomonas phage vB_SmaS_DLP_5]|uniref:Methyltransferase n=1 Tax=Stenotrophomonas phage vB_SmaS_DLP_5 TaxID=2044561 RepID=A0A2D2W2F1_9CAUD|nr:methyltransferase [Stenotrophomonas phage vB_SmaS_DLP_5]ATS92317.1 methyltransferase [Stenotrophomonas phage vB_SmaS_DLP_5]